MSDVYMVFNRNAQAEKRFNPGFDKRAQQPVGEREIVGCGTGGVGGEITEQVRDVHKHTAAEHTANIVQPGKRDPRFGEIVEHGKVHPGKGRLTDTMHRLDGAGYLRPVYGNIDHMRFPSLCFMYTAAVVENHRG